MSSRARTMAPRAEGLGPSAYLPVGLVAGSVIALQIAVMRVFAVGSWVHFGSLVVSLAMFGFGLASAVMCLGTWFFEKRWRQTAATSLMLFGPLAVASNLAAQQVPFNAIFLISDPAQKWRLAANFLLYFLPFLSGAFFLGSVFLRAREFFARVYFADLAGSGLSGLAMLGAMYGLEPSDLILGPLVLWALGGLLWFRAMGTPRQLIGFGLMAALAFAAHVAAPSLGLTTLSVSDYKGVAYARKFPDQARVYRSISPFGDLEIYSSSYLHFAPGLSDNAAFNLPEEPANAYLAMYNDGEGPTGIIRNLPDSQTAYFRYLPMYYPYVLKTAPDTFVAQLAGGIPVAVALRAGAAQVTAAEANPEVLKAFEGRAVADFTGDLLHNPKLEVIGQEGRLWLKTAGRRFDVIDLSLGDGTGLSSPGGFAITEKYGFTREAMATYMGSLKDGGILSVTLWNKEDPPKSILKLYATMAEAARAVGQGDPAQSFYAVSSYLSTTTVLYKRGGFSGEEVNKLTDFTKSLSFDEVYRPGLAFDASLTTKLLAEYDAQIFGNGGADADAGSGEVLAPPNDDNAPQVLPATSLERLVWRALIDGRFDDIARRYVFNIAPLSNDRPYFAAYVKPADLTRITDRLELFQDDWGYLLLWATLGIAAGLSVTLIAIPAIFGWRSIFSRTPGKAGTMVYFACLGLGYIMTEVGLIAKFVLALANPTVSASILLSGILVFSGLGSLVSERILPTARASLPKVLIAISLLLLAGSLFGDAVLDWIGGFSYAARLALSVALVAPVAFLMGFPMPTAMTTLARLGKEPMFLWAWGINGSASVIGAAAVPVLATSFGLASVLQVSAAAYLLALPCFFAVSRAPG
ncbi:MAG: hypothetical protein HYX36_08935 [Rhizobiales bacterium]|nr:hypothetical protein [Hyphomicrobiales bacterium]